MSQPRRNFLKGTAAVATAVGTAQAQGTAKQAEGPVRKIHYKNGEPKNPPLFSSAVSYGNLLFIAGKGAHYEGDIGQHTKTVLEDIQKELENAGSSMEKVLKCNVYLHDLKHYAAMNEAFKGWFGDKPPVRTTIAAAGGIPGNSLIEIDVIAFI